MENETNSNYFENGQEVFYEPEENSNNLTISNPEEPAQLKLETQSENEDATKNSFEEGSSPFIFEVPDPSSIYWQPDSETDRCSAPNCNVQFTLLNRRHHCRLCGKIFCNTCSNKIGFLQDNPKPLRTCDNCFHKYKQISPVVRSKEDAKRTYNRLSGVYDVVSGYEKSYRDEGVKMLDLQKGERVLEIGIGTGQCLVQFAKSVGPLGGVYGVDISESMVKQAKKRVEREMPNSSFRLEVADGMNLPFEKEFFDALFMCFTLELFSASDISLVLQECSRVLKKGGRLCVVGLSKKVTGKMVNFYHYMHFAFPNLVDCRPIYVEETLNANSFQTVIAKDMPLYGLLVEIILVKKT